MSESSTSIGIDHGGAYELWKQEAMASSSKNGCPKQKSLSALGKTPLNCGLQLSLGNKSMSSLRPSSSLTSRRMKCCSVCARLAFMKPSIYSAMFNYDEEFFLERDAGFFDIVHQMNDFVDNDTRMSNRADRYRVDRDVARQTADAAEKCVRELRTDMLERGLLQSPDQNFTGDSNMARVLAPVHSDEIQLGTLLGVGGFSAVLEIASFRLDPNNGATVAAEEELSRRHLHSSVVRRPGAPDDVDDEPVPTRRGVWWRRKENCSNKSSEEAVPRYALKHLRFNLAKDPDKFRRSCIDLVLEGQLLLAMDHPNIMGIRGWPLYGTDAIRSGKLLDYFLILDKLPETLEQRISTWRNKHRKYRARCSFPLFQLQKYGPKLDSLFLERLHAVQNVASAIQYMHSKGIIHRDIKSANIGFDVRGELKLFDFGLSRLLPKTNSTDDGSSSAESAQEIFCMSRVGTKFYIAPEVRSSKPYGLPADVYSFGVLFWELLSLSSPRDLYNERKRRRTIQENAAACSEDEPSRESVGQVRLRRKNIRIEDVPEEHNTIMAAGWLPICPCWPKSVQNLILSCLRAEPDHRPLMVEVGDQIAYAGLTLFGDDGSYIEDSYRRRSTFRVDLAKFRQHIRADGGANSFADPTIIAEASCDSKTSAESSDLHMMIESSAESKI